MKKKLAVHIEAEFGSEWQEKVQSASLRMMLVAWGMHMKNGNKKNIVFINGHKL